MPFLLDPASQRGVTRSHTAPRCGIQKKLGQESRKIHSLLRSSLDPASQRGVTRSHTAPRCGIQKMLERESPPNPFLLRPTLDPASQRGVTCRSYRTLMRYPGKARAGVSARYIPFTSLSGPASQRWVTLSVIPHPDAVSRKRSGKSVRQIHSFYVPLWTPRRSAG